MGWIGPTISAATTVFGMLFGGKDQGIDKETKKRLLAFINANLPMFQKLLSQQYCLRYALRREGPGH